jgi:hypothetical protein
MIIPVTAQIIGRPIVIICLLSLSVAFGQNASSERPPVAGEVFKNAQVMKGIPVNQFMDTMGFFSAALGLNCTGCHVAKASRT